MARQNRSVLHATGSRSFTQTLRRYAGRGSTRLQSLFKYFNSFMDAEPNDIEVLICDEAHRVRETSVNRYTPKARRDVARPQLEELISLARVPVFLLDEHQVVKPGELGSVEVISAFAEKLASRSTWSPCTISSVAGAVRRTRSGFSTCSAGRRRAFRLGGRRPVRRAGRRVARGGGLPRRAAGSQRHGQDVGRLLLALE
ncbi:DNA/RNA helicase domain-containing protein [Micromonospora sp. M12]